MTILAKSVAFTRITFKMYKLIHEDCEALPAVFFITMGVEKIDVLEGCGETK